MKKILIKDITGHKVEVTNIRKAIEQCRNCADSPFKMESGHTVGQNHAYMLEQLIPLWQKRNYERLGENVRKHLEQGKRLPKDYIGYCIGMVEPESTYAYMWDHYKRPELVKAFNRTFGTDIK